MKTNRHELSSDHHEPGASGRRSFPGRQLDRRAGFASRASGKFHDELRKDFTSRIETLLAEKAPVSSRVSASNTC
jgi:hypothetical protein